MGREKEATEGRRVCLCGQEDRARETVCTCAIECKDKSGSEERSRVQRDDPFREHDSAGELK